MRLLKQKVRKLLAKIVTSILLFPFPTLRRDVKRALQSGGLILDTMWKYRLGEPEKFKYNLSLLICVRDESKNIAEWLEYHLLQESSTSTYMTMTARMIRGRCCYPTLSADLFPLFLSMAEVSR